MNIIELIMSNLLPFIIIVGGLISFFGRMTKENNEKQQRQQMPAGQQQEETKAETTNEKQIDWRDLFNTDEFEQKTSWPGSEPVKASEVEQQNSDLKQEQEKQREKKRKLDERLKEIRKRSSAQSEQPVASESNGLNLQFDQISNKEAMKGVVWAEVLGRPRARQPHQTFVRNRRNG
ncbi:hypothetical protein [Halalkalibacter hemicellulosilyticus]|uniref:Uncharacterized protein n=1 Tax=Halalkalibacter hemicellulosilyticusJCM 9152 TaxID=1236971 RepID=W4QH40_9BACI|nr:hypothetical protein [Halalkalibacter hemicellulosilyticus]GAE30669.1 hypothetical protein JCM9152_2083 [Halalkalibacter hemicellulosilyticusJCM 9152]